MSDKQTPRGFIEKYASISDMDTSQVISLLDIQDRQDTKYSRVKTCEKLWNAATKATRAEYDDKIKAMQTEIDTLKETIDMNDAIIDGMRRILAVSRMVNNQRPDIRMTHALNDYDKCKLKN